MCKLMFEKQSPTFDVTMAFMLFRIINIVRAAAKVWKRQIQATLIVEQIPWASFQGGGLRSTTFVAIYQNVRLGL